MRRKCAYYKERDETAVQRAAAWKKRNPHKKAAHDAVYYALKTGEIVRGTCEVCGNTDVEAHHTDYTRPLDVRWFCITHHSSHHVNLRERGG